MKRIVFVSALLAILISCGKPDPVPGPVPPPPVPPVVVTKFEVRGISVKVEGEVKAGAKVTAEQAKAILQAKVNGLK